ncbi:hypothetical protein ES705_48549 [subsurface metagenome]
MYAENETDKRNISVVSSGKAAEHALIGMLNFSFYDVRRKICRIKQAGRGGIGTVFRDKKIKALVIKVSGVKGDMNRVVDMNAIRERGRKFNKEMMELDDSQARMKQVGTAHLVEIMNDYDLLPVHNFKFGSHPDAHKIDSKVLKKRFTQGMPDGCWLGCMMSCCKTVEGYEMKTGPYKGQIVTVDGPEYETVGALGSCCGIFDPEHPFECNFYCDTYGIDTISFAAECYENGILNEERTGGLKLSFGNADAVMELLHQMARGEGFGVVVGSGVRKMKENSSRLKGEAEFYSLF